MPADTLPAAWRILHSPTNVMAPGSTARDIRLLWLLAASNAARLAPGRASIVPFLDKQTHPKNYVLCTPEGLEILANYSREVRRQTPRAHVHTDPPVPLLPHPPPSSCSQCTGEWLCKYREKSRHAHSTHDVSHILRLLNQAGVGRYEAGGFFVERLPNADAPPRRGRHRAAPRRRRADLEAQGQGDAGRLRPEAHALARGGCRTTAAWLQRRASGGHEVS